MLEGHGDLGAAPSLIACPIAAAYRYAQHDARSALLIPPLAPSKSSFASRFEQKNDPRSQFRISLGFWTILRISDGERLADAVGDVERYRWKFYTAIAVWWAKAPNSVWSPARTCLLLCG